MPLPESPTNTWILKSSPAENMPGYPQALSSEGVDLVAFQHFVCLTGNFYSPSVYFSSQLMSWYVTTAGTALSGVTYPKNVFLSSGKLRMGRASVSPFPVTPGA